MSNLPVVSFAGANLPAVANLSTALRGIQSEVGSGDVIMKMDKTGVWVYGADQTEVEEGSNWAINPFSFIHGYIAWGEGEKLDERMVPVSQPLPEVPAAPPGAKRGWELQVGFSLRCMDGEDAGLEARFAVSSVGGKRAVQKIGAEIAARVDQEQSKGAAASIVPVARLEADSYLHKSYGKIYTPIFNIVQWLPMSGDAAATEPQKVAEAQQQQPEPAAAAPAETGRRRRRAA